MIDNKVEVVLVSGTTVRLERDTITSGENGLIGYNANEKKHYQIPIRSILFVRSDKPFDDEQ